MSAKCDLIMNVLHAGRAIDLRSLAGGISPYSRESQLRKSFDPSSMTDDDHYFWICAMQYLQCVGDGTEPKCFQDAREGFEKWLEVGAPLLFEDELAAYLIGNPLRSELK
jgi:hypothetical protein